MSKLLLEEYPLIVLPGLAKAIGLNEAIILQQLHYWLGKSDHEHDGRRWVYNTYEGWQDQFPFWSIPTIRRALASLSQPREPGKEGEEAQRVARGPLVLVARYNRAGFDKTNWYAIDYDELDRLGGMIRRSDQNDQTMGSERSDGADQNDQTNTRDYQRLPTDSIVDVAAFTSDHQSALDALLGIGFQPESVARQYVLQASGPEQVIGWCEYVKEQKGLRNPAGWVRKALDAGEPAPVAKPAGVEVENEDLEVPEPPTAEEEAAAAVIGQWRRVLEVLHLQIDPATYNSWLKGSRPASWEDGHAVIQVRSTYAADWLKHRLTQTVERAAAQVAGHQVAVTFEAVGE